MAKDSVENFVSNTAAALIGGGIVTGLALVTPELDKNIGPALTTLIWLALIVVGITFFVLFKYYFDVLGSAKKTKNTREYQAYLSLRHALGAGGFSTQIYVRRLTWFLDSVDTFFGDTGHADRTLFPGAFGLKAAAPLWTAPSFDRCLLLALYYPLATIFTIWTVTGHVGPAEAALGLRGSASAWQRVLAALLFITTTFCSSKSTVTKEGRPRIRFFWLLASGLSAFGLAGAVSGTTTGTLEDTFKGAVIALFFVAGPVAGTASVAAVTFSGAGVIAGIVAATFIVGTGIAIGNNISAITVIIITALCSFIFLVSLTYQYSIIRRRQGLFLSLYLPSMIVLVMFSSALLSSERGWSTSGSPLLFLGLLTLLNAPFDWLSLGLTRALLRRGIELKAWWPYGLALVDAVLAVVVIAALCFVMVVGVQTFDFLATLQGGKPVLPLTPLFEDIRHNSGAPEYWWIYALLFSTMIPSVINLVIGGASLWRGIPGISAHILHYMPEGKAVAALDRNWMALLLTLQWLLGAILGIAAQGILVWAFFGHILPWLGFDMLAVARALAEFNLPAHVYQLLP